MAIVQKTWPNGDTLTLDMSVGGISIISNQNLTNVDREMVIQLRTTNQGEKATSSFTVKQAKWPFSYIITTDETRIDFDSDNTPLSNFSTSSGATSSITINSQSVVKNTIKEIYFGDSYNDITSIRNNFLYNCINLTSVDLSGLSNVISIGDSFLGNCSSLTSINLSPLSNITGIGRSFLSGCSSLTSIDLSPLSNITSIGNYFLYRCSSLIYVDLSPLNNITTIQTYFINNCSSLTSVDLSGLSNVISIGDYFLSNCSSLTSVDLSSLNNITMIRHHFLSGNSNLSSIDLNPLSSVTSIGNSFLFKCSSLIYVDLSPLNNITSIGNAFLSNCYILTTLKMGAKTPPTLGSGAFNLSNNLSLIQVPCGSESAYKSATYWISKLNIIEGDCRPSYMILTNNTIIDFDLDNTPISNLSNTYSSMTINGQSVVKNTIKEIYLGHSYGEVTSIGVGFLYNCLSLESVNLSGLSNITSIGNAFLSGCSNLTSVNLSTLNNITIIESGFLFECSSLTTLKMGAKIPPTLGSNAFMDTNNLSLIQVPCGYENDYKSAANWIDKADIIKGNC